MADVVDEFMKLPVEKYGEIENEMKELLGTEQPGHAEFGRIFDEAMKDGSKYYTSYMAGTPAKEIVDKILNDIGGGNMVSTSRNTLDFEQFRDQLQEQLLKRNGEVDGEISYHEVMKNRQTLHGMTFRPDGADVGITVYAEDSYEFYKKGGTVDQAVDGIISTFNAPEVRAHMPVNVDNLINKENIVPVFIPRAGNEQMLQEIPHVPFEDLEIIFRFNIPECGMATIDNKQAESLGLNEKELMPIAMNNPAYTENITIKGMSETMAKIQPGRIPVLPLEEEEIIIISNKAGFYGASGVLNVDTMKKITDIFGEDAYVLPSSIHECLAVKKSKGTVAELRDMVREVNNSMVLPEERLSDQIYQFDSKMKKLSMAVDSPVLEHADFHMHPQIGYERGR